MIRIGIYGYGNLGKGAEAAIKKNSDMELVAVFTRRNPKDLVIATEGAEVVAASDILKYKDSIFALFCMSVFICSILEYFTSYIMEKLFNARWWDYSH